MYKETRVIEYNDVDCYGRIKMNFLFTRLAEVATEDALKTGIMNDEFMKHFGWVVSRQTLELSDDLRLGDEITVTTYPKKPSAAIFPRYYTIEKKGVVVGECFSIWTILDLEHRRIARASQTGLTFPDIKERMAKMPKRLKKIDGEKTASYEVQFSDIDLNQHMNNTCYIRLAYNLIDMAYLKDHILSSLSINYEKEVAPHTVVDLYVEKEGDTYRIEGRQSVSCFLVEMNFREADHD